MAGDLQNLPLTRRRVLLGIAAVAANALAACGKEPTASNSTTSVSPTPAPTRIVVVPTPLPTPILAPPLTPAVPTVGSILATTTSAPTAPLIVFGGGALAQGAGVRPADSFPALTIALLAPATYDAVNVAESSGNLSIWDAYAAKYLDPLYAPSRSKNIAVLHGGSSDISPAGASVPEAFARLASYCQARRSVGFKVVAMTMLPRTGSLRAGEDFETERQEFNTLMHTNRASFADALADVGADATIGVASARGNLTYYQGNGVLPTAEGHRIIAPIVAAAIKTL